MQVTGKVDERCPHAERSAPFRRWEGGRSRGTAGRESLAPAPRVRTRSAAASQGGTTGLGTGQRIPGRRACCPVVTPGPRFAGVNDRRRRRATGAARSAGGPSHPAAVTTSPYHLATPHGRRDWQGRTPAHVPSPPHWVPSRDCSSGPASLPFVRRGCERALRDPTALEPAPAEPPRQSPSHGAGTAWPYAQQCTYPRGGGRGTRKGPRPRGVGAASSPARPAQSQARSQRLAFHGLQYGAGRKILARCRGQGGPPMSAPAWPGPPPPVERLRWAEVGITPGLTGAALPRLSLDCGEA